MIADTVAYDIVFLVHILSAVAMIVVLLVMRASGQAVARGADASTQSSRFPNRRNWAARLLHILPITGFIMSGTGGHDVALSQPWIGIGLLCYLAAAGHLEARTLPLERSIAATIASNGSAEPSVGATFTRSLDVLLGIVAVALLVMVIQPHF